MELVLNGAHQGAYQLCDHVEVATNRVPATNADWFLEIVDFRRIEADETWFRSTALDAWSMQSDPTPSVWVYKQPDPPSATQRATVEGDIRRLEEVLYGAGFAHPDTGYARSWSGNSGTSASPSATTPTTPARRAGRSGTRRGWSDCSKAAHSSVA